MTMVKFKIGFTIDAESLFAYVSKLMPSLHDFQVEEVYVAPPVVERPIPKVAQLVATRQIAKPIKPIKKRNVNRQKFLEAGANKVVLDVLADKKPHTSDEIKAAMKAAGFAETGAGAKMSKIKGYGLVFQPEIGQWQLKE
jgi:hypothetical protein